MIDETMLIQMWSQQVLYQNGGTGKDIQIGRARTTGHLVESLYVGLHDFGCIGRVRGRLFQHGQYSRLIGFGLGVLLIQIRNAMSGHPVDHQDSVGGVYLLVRLNDGHEHDLCQDITMSTDPIFILVFVGRSRHDDGGAYTTDNAV